MKKVKIDFDTNAEKTFKTEIETKINAFKKLLSNLEEFVDTIDLEALYSNPEAYSKESIIKEYESSYKRIQHDKLFDLIGFSLIDLKKQSDIFKSIGHNFNYETLEYTTPDFNIYAETTEQIERYNASKKAIEALTELRQLTPMHSGMLIQALGKTVKPDYKSGFVQPSSRFILTGLPERGM